MSEQRLSINDGQYEFVLRDDDWRVEVWCGVVRLLCIEQGRHAIASLMSECADCRQALAAKDAEIEQLKGLLQEWLAAYLEEFGEPDPAYFDRLDRAYVAAKEALAGTGETR